MNDNFLLPSAGPWAGQLRDLIRARRLAGGSAHPMAGERKPNEVSLEDGEQICTRSCGERLAHLRSRMGMTLDMAAVATGISKSELSRLETGKRTLTDRHIAALASAYGLTECGLRYIMAVTLQHAFMPDAGDIPAIDTRKSHDMNCFSASQLMASAESAPRPITIPLPFRFSEDAYCVTFDTPYSGTILPVGSLLIVDPRERALIGDIVLNRTTWMPLIVSLVNTPRGLAGQTTLDRVDFGPDVRLEDFHKIVAIISSANVMAPEIGG